MSKNFNIRKLFILIALAAMAVSAFSAFIRLYTAEVCAGEIPAVYRQVLYNQESGLGLDSSEINSVYQTASGYVWVGTSGGLYRFNGSEFQSYNLWDTDRADVYQINSLFQDSQGRLWVSTDNYGLFYIKGTDVHHFTNEYYSGIKVINGVCEDSLGTVYVATAYGLYTVNEDELTLERDETLAGHNIRDICAVGDEIWGIYTGNNVFKIDAEKRVAIGDMSEYSSEEYTSIAASESGQVYVTSGGNMILKLSGLSSVTQITIGFYGINDIYPRGSRMYVCTDGGFGYLSEDDSFTKIVKLDVSTYLSSMMIDYEGNMWIASGRFGLLLLQRSKFTNLSQLYNMSLGNTNAVYRYDDMTYIGTDSGLTILDASGTKVENELTEYVSSVSIRDIKCDASGGIWLAAYRRYGVVRYDRSGNLSSYSKSFGLPSNLINCITVLSSQSVAVGTDDGIAIISHGGALEKTYTYDDGIEYSILCICEAEDGSIYAGSDGGGLYRITDDGVTRYTESDGLSSNVITGLRFGTGGLWITTDNGLSYYDATFRAISSIDFSNNLYDIQINDTTVYMMGSKGLLVAEEDELLSNQYLGDRYLTAGDGLDETLTTNSNSYLSGDGTIYLCTAGGVLTYNPDDEYIDDQPPKLVVSEVNVDGQIYYLDQIGGELKVPSTTKRVEIAFSVLSFTNRDSIKVRYMLTGFDEDIQELRGNDVMRVVYTNLEGGEYTLTVDAVNADGVESDEAISFKITKELGFLEMKSTRVSITLIILALLLTLAIVIRRLLKQFARNKRELDQLARKHEDTVKSSNLRTDYLANMSNEIKLPMNAIITTAGNMLKDEDAYSRENLQTIIDKSNDVIDRVDETIQLARLDSGAEKLVSEPYSITTLVCDLSDRMINLIGSKPIKFLVDLGESLPDILIGDFEKLKKVLEILLDNANMYTQEGTITLSVDSYDNGDGVTLIFSVSDTGIGLSKERLEHIFEIYYKDELSRAKDDFGNGVNLAIARKLVEILRGGIEADSTYGSGSTFTVTLKQKLPDSSTHSAVMSENSIERVSRDEAGRMWAPDVRALIVDDSELSIEVTANVLKGMDIQFDKAMGGMDAIDMIMEKDYDIVFMDIAMPVMNGIDTLREIRELDGDRFRSMPIIAMSEDAIGKNRQDIISSGFTEVVVKPFDNVILAGVLMKCVDVEKLKIRTNDVTQYIDDSKYYEGLKRLEDYLDVVGTLEKIGGSIKVYNRILITFYNQNRDEVSELRSKYYQNFRQFRNRVHNIRTSCQNMGAIDAAQITLDIGKCYQYR